jgi:hypothetical protein
MPISSFEYVLMEELMEWNELIKIKIKIILIN